MTDQQKQRELNKALIADNDDLRIKYNDLRKQLAAIQSGSASEPADLASNTTDEQKQGDADNGDRQKQENYLPWKLHMESDDEATAKGPEREKSGAGFGSGQRRSYLAQTQPLLGRLPKVMGRAFGRTESVPTTESSLQASSGTVLATELGDATESNGSVEPAARGDMHESSTVLELFRNAAVFVFFAATLQTYIACRRERSRWLEANNLSRSYLFSMLHYNASLLVAPGANPDLSLGIQTLPQVWEVVKHTASVYAYDVLTSLTTLNAGIMANIQLLVR